MNYLTEQNKSNSCYFIPRDFYLSLFTKGKDSVLSMEECLRLSFRLFSAGEEAEMKMADASELWSRFDVYETTQDHDRERVGLVSLFWTLVMVILQIEEDMFIKKSLARMENIKLQHNM